MPMSFGFNVRCCTVAESYTVYVFYTNIELFRDWSLFMQKGGQGFSKLAKRAGAIVSFWCKDKGGNMIQYDLQYKKSIQDSQTSEPVGQHGV